MVIGGLSIAEIRRLMPLRRRQRQGEVGGPLDGLNCRLAFLRWRLERGEMSEWPLDDGTAERLRNEIMEQIRRFDHGTG